MASKRIVVWFKGTNDLRVHDNPLLARAAQLCAELGGDAEVVPAYSFDPFFFGVSELGSNKMGPHRARFLVESVADLRAQLRAQCASDLLVGVGPPERLIGPLVGSAPAGGAVLLMSDEVASEEREAVGRVRSAVRATGTPCDVESFWMSTVYHRDDLPFGGGARGARANGGGLERMPDMFTPFKERVERELATRPMARTPAAGELPLPPKRDALASDGVTAGECARGFDLLPSLAQLGMAEPMDDPRGVLRFVGGEAAALRRVRHYLWDTDCLRSYFETRNGMIGADYSSKLSPWLAHGCLSPLKVVEEVGRYEAARVKNKSTYWLIFELLWRDFFRFYAVKHGNAIFKLGGITGERREWVTGAQAAERLRRWKEGSTGLPLVDANMREMAATGFMSNRGRQNVASYLALDLAVDWRLGADHFEGLLLDYDVASNWGNWVSAAGLARAGRVNQFNIVKQGRDYDADGAYVRLWCPELRAVPAEYIHTPWEMPQQLQDKLGVRIGEDYPSPLAVPPGHAFRGAYAGGRRPATGNAPIGGRAPNTDRFGRRPSDGGGAGEPGAGSARRRPPRGGRVQR
ncbi:hypothetical protein KFE25_006690 [Diacronema lutheri]|uniref:Cryptochrome DASH n=2 Tax=Diacronema lutheri TaxID=2081491 RepID=A0A8J5XME0_DIALT|nr:hypothetical protein KFE25_006690 [Diacronema lutheri]